MSHSSQRELFAGSCGPLVTSERELVSLAVALGADRIAGWSPGETQLASRCGTVPDRALVRDVARQIEAGADPLGDAFCRLRSAAERRGRGATYTPPAIVDDMLKWAAEAGRPQQVIDPGTGSGRFLIAAGRAFPRAQLIGVEIDPLAALLARANLAAAGLGRRGCLLVRDYRERLRASGQGPTLFIGNPPYVRHHQIESRWKRWLVAAAGRRGIKASGLAGLHAHFYVATAEHARAGDLGCFVTSAEWLDVNYGSVIRELLLGELGLNRLAVVEPTAMPFPDATTTAVIAQFQVGAVPRHVAVSRVQHAGALRHQNGGTLSIPREKMREAPRWSMLSRRRRRRTSGLVELGELCRVHRGQVTGDNGFWIAGPHSRELPESLLFPAITRARELFEAGTVLASAETLRRVIDLPADLSVLRPEDRRAVERFLVRARERAVPKGYIASKRRPWWSVRLREPAPILATYMARRPPAFVYNVAQARHINIAHGIYPRELLEPAVLSALATYLSSRTHLESGRTYAGGLTKFEPREMERLLVPRPESLREAAG